MLSETRRLFHPSNFAKNKTKLAALVGVVALASVTFFLLRPPAVPDLAKGNNVTLTDFKSRWAQGDVIVLVRHVERCDHSSAPCLGPADGITLAGKSVAEAVGQHFQTLGLGKADIYSSPMTRTAQTAAFMFNYAGAGQDWLFNCRQNMLSDSLQHKVKNRNLILVTHSECMSALEKTMKLRDSSTPDYGSSLFISMDDHQQPHVLGFINANDWPKVLAN